MKRKLLIAVIAVASASALHARAPQEMAVRVAVADVRAERTPAGADYVYDPLQETQVLRGERVLVVERKGKWVRVECPEQPEFTHHNRWEGYPGWIELDKLTADLSNAPLIQPLALSEDELRESIVHAAGLNVGTPYLWGGRSLHDENIAGVRTGVDCSGLVNWSYRKVGRLIPRDAHEQFMKATPVEPARLKPGDLIFTAKAGTPDKIVHVALYAGDGEIIEGPQSGENVRRVSVEKRYGKKLEDLKNKETLDDRVVYFGSFLTGEP